MAQFCLFVCLFASLFTECVFVSERTETKEVGYIYRRSNVAEGRLKKKKRRWTERQKSQSRPTTQSPAPSRATSAFNRTDDSATSAREGRGSRTHTRACKKSDAREKKTKKRNEKKPSSKDARTSIFFAFGSESLLFGEFAIVISFRHSRV